MTNEELEELTAWRRRVSQAQQIIQLVAMGRRVWMRQACTGWEVYGPSLDNGLGCVVYDLDRRTGLPTPRYRIIGANPN